MSNLVVCKKTVIEEWTDEALSAAADFKNLDFFDGLINVWLLFFNADTVAHSCYQGVESIAK
jgi:hypothetical protein